MYRNPNHAEYAEEPTRKIRELNDILRNTFITGRVLFTKGFTELDNDLKSRFILAIRAYKDFTPDNDPYGEHDFGSVTIDDTKIFWKIDYYDTKLEHHSPDPSDPKQTIRIMTVMLADEY